jgi:hypothetical protein
LDLIPGILRVGGFLLVEMMDRIITLLVHFFQNEKSMIWFDHAFFLDPV